MKRILEDAMEAGAIGFASSTFENHNGYAGVPMPSRLADDEEFETMIGVLGEKGRGLFMITVGQRTTVGTLAGYARCTGRQIGKAHVQTTVTHAKLVCRLPLDKK